MTTLTLGEFLLKSLMERLDEEIKKGAETFNDLSSELQEQFQLFPP